MLRYPVWTPSCNLLIQERNSTSQISPISRAHAHQDITPLMQSSTRQLLQPRQRPIENIRIPAISIRICILPNCLIRPPSWNSPHTTSIPRHIQGAGIRERSAITLYLKRITISECPVYSSSSKNIAWQVCKYKSQKTEKENPKKGIFNRTYRTSTPPIIRRINNRPSPRRSLIRIHKILYPRHHRPRTQPITRRPRRIILNIQHSR